MTPTPLRNHEKFSTRKIYSQSIHNTHFPNQKGIRRAAQRDPAAPFRGRETWSQAACSLLLGHVSGGRSDSGARSSPTPHSLHGQFPHKHNAVTGREGIPPASSGAEGEDLSEQGGIPSRSYSPPTLCGDFASSHDAPHKAEVIRDMYYRYDPNGNVTEERQGGHSDDSVSKTFMYSTYCRLYSWDEENRLTGTSDRNYTTSYSYYHEGERTVKYSHLGETLYFDSMWLEADTDGTGKLRQTKNIYIGETRIASKLNYEDGDIEYEKTHTFYYHTDHLSSSNVITDYEGDVYEHMEYTPKDACASSKLACDQHYGEKWILDQNDSSKYDMIPYRFTAKEWDEEDEAVLYECTVSESDDVQVDEC